MKNDGPQPNWNASDRSTMDRIKERVARSYNCRKADIELSFESAYVLHLHHGHKTRRHRWQATIKRLSYPTKPADDLYITGYHGKDSHALKALNQWTLGLR
ncbi:hypothetical protein HBH98_012070 [Parastagonospora nodorum]|nr:hypothetical protein HBI09_015830 [Parastagonospora nodorum]KAH4069166.1 hypothetical protein HBH50_109670 [Parastagonospora nodorum]KAH4088235.1 hypothetical protein HBH48_126640 [Parastagonospora nodorum]KAH4133273.1 hypothetical protein HBH47_009840 [Parastagonospora nodorum]KAH4353893.1 hypothetical protein HBH98_012070 [Parastagonospora nodorum]